MGNRWYEIAKDSVGDDGARHLNYVMVFETEDKGLRKQIEDFYRNLVPTEAIYGRGN